MANYFIIGASSGIGRQLALQLSGEGHTVYGTYHHHIAESNLPLLEYHHLNVLEETLSLDYLPEVMDGLVYCPGTISLKPFNRIKPEDITADFQLNVSGAIKTIQAALPLLKKSAHPAIVLFSTVAVQLGLSFHTQVAVSKGAIEGLTRALAAELAPAIRVNCIAPSLTDTPLAASLLGSEEKREANAQRHPMKKIGRPEDIANMASFLLSDKAGWITGQIIHVDGGMGALKV
jgi:NAD(P)-dependent dehydrogenase (short-subunit alcohol dehydrogenase family)